MKKLIFTLILSLLTFSCATLQVGKTKTFFDKELNEMRYTRITESNIYYYEFLDTDKSSYYNAPLKLIKDFPLSPDEIYFELLTYDDSKDIFMRILSTSDSYIQSFLFYTSPKDKIKVSLSPYDEIDEIYNKYKDISKENRLVILHPKQYSVLKEIISKDLPVYVLVNTLNGDYKYKLSNSQQKVLKEFLNLKK